MKNLLKYLSPFAPDQSGASGVLYELGGLTVICDAGGCTGNICGFDEPRWLEKKSALFSAGLRDMDAILGRDDRLIQKLKAAVSKTKSDFTAIIGTPVPAVIATDFKALKTMAEKKTSLPCIAIECTGTKYYDEGEETAYLELFKTFAAEQTPIQKGRLGIIGASPLEISQKTSDSIIKAAKENGWENPICYGMGSGIEEIKAAAGAEKNLVIAPSGIKAAKYLQNKFGTPFEVDYPFIPESIKNQLSSVSGKVLIIHQQMIANKIRNLLRENGNCQCSCATWFMQIPEYTEEKDIKLKSEEQLADIVNKEKYDFIIGDKAFGKPVRNFNGKYIDFPHFAVSGRLI